MKLNNTTEKHLNQLINDIHKFSADVSSVSMTPLQDSVYITVNTEGLPRFQMLKDGTAVYYSNII